MHCQQLGAPFCGCKALVMLREGVPGPCTPSQSTEGEKPLGMSCSASPSLSGLISGLSPFLHPINPSSPPTSLLHGVLAIRVTEQTCLPPGPSDTLPPPPQHWDSGSRHGDPFPVLHLRAPAVLSVSPPDLAQEVRTHGMYGDTSLRSAVHVAAVPPRGSTTRGQRVAQSLGTRRGAGGATGCTLWRWGCELEHPTRHCWWHPGAPASSPPPPAGWCFWHNLCVPRPSQALQAPLKGSACRGGLEISPRPAEPKKHLE